MRAPGPRSHAGRQREPHGALTIGGVVHQRMITRQVDGLHLVRAADTRLCGTPAARLTTQRRHWKSLSEPITDPNFCYALSQAKPERQDQCSR
jgi:hypothetical protein